MAKFTGFIISLLMLGVAQAAEIADAPIPEPNYVGIIVFLVLMFGGGAWFMWRVMRTKGKPEDKK